MLLMQFSIGAANDWFDVDLDSVAKPSKPIPAGLVGRPTAAVVATASGGGGLALAALFGASSGLSTLIVAVAILGCGLVYDAVLKRTSWGWVAFAVAFPLLPIYAWMGSTGQLPPGAQFLIPVAFLAGPTLQLANGLVDVEGDSRAGVTGLAGMLGRQRGWLTMLVLELAVYAVAITTVFADPLSSMDARTSVIVAGGLAAVGVALTKRSAMTEREWGWRFQAIALAVLAAGWLLWRSAVPPGG